MKQSIEGAFRYAGKVEVSRQGPDAQKAFIWTVVFTSAVDIIPQLIAKSYLTGSGATVTMETLVQGNTINGYFSLDFMGQTTRPIKHDITEHQFRAILEQDLPIETAHVIRNDPLHECDSGECGSNPFGAGGYHWKLVLVTPMSTLSPTSPTAKINDTWLYPTNEYTGEDKKCLLPSAEDPDMSIRLCLDASVGWGCTFRSQSNISFPTQCRDPTNRQVFTMDPHWRLNIASLNLNGTNVSLVVTDDVVYELAFGGNGGANGGAGGQGRGLNPAATDLGTPLEDLLGGSGGAAAGCHPDEVIERTDPVRGGNGGGAMYLSAYNDIVLGYSAVLDVNGEKGQDGRRGGGGGSGGSVAIHAGGVVTIYGTVTAKGGAGGDSQGVNMDGWGMSSGGGGGGGRIAVTCESYTDEGTVTAKGGDAGKFPKAMEILLRLSRATSTYTNATNVSNASTTWKGATEPDAAIGNVTLNQYGWSVEDRFDSDQYSSSTDVDRRKAATAGPGGIGGEGIVHVRRTLGVKMRIDPKEGASSTSKSLRIDGGDISNTSSKVLKHNPRQLDGPQFRLYKGSKPERVTVFVKMGGLTAGTSSSNWGIMLSLHGRVGAGNAASNGTNATNTTNTTNTTASSTGERRRTNGVYNSVHGRTYGGGDGNSGNRTRSVKEKKNVIDANFSSGWRDTRSQENTLPVAIAMGAINGKFRHEGNPGGVPRYTFHDTVVLDRW